jgi:hypothetical protein
MRILHEFRLDAGSSKIPFVPALEKEAALILEILDVDDQ